MTEILLIHSLARSITKAASLQTYLTVRFLVDRSRVQQAFQAYAYFRWLDDQLDQERTDQSASLALIRRQEALLAGCLHGKKPDSLSLEEQMMVELILGKSEPDSGLCLYFHHMMAVMAFDAERRGRLVSQAELEEYTHNLAAAVTEALHYFIGHDCPTPRCEERYLAAAGAHITHMLRDTFDDVAAGYYNIPVEVLRTHCITPQDLGSEAYRRWVRSRVRLAQTYLQAGKNYLAQVKNLRCRLAGFAYIARFEVVLDIIRSEDYLLRADYSDAYQVSATMQKALWLVWSSLVTLNVGNRTRLASRQEITGK